MFGRSPLAAVATVAAVAGALAAIPALAGGCASPFDEGSTTADSLEEPAARDAWTPPEAYAEGKLHSDLTPEIVRRLKEIHAAGTGDDDAFIKVGDSITVSTSFLTCFARTPMTGDHAALEDTRTFFDPASFTRQSRAAKVGWHTNEPLVGNPTPLAIEVREMRPAFAIVMLGTNDLYEGTQPSYERHLKGLVRALVDQGIVPILSTIPPIRNATQNAVVPKVNLIVRRIAAESSVPLMDYHRTLVDLPSYGLSSDGIHPYGASTGACDFSPTAMRAGYNQRNLLALTALHRVRQAVILD